ncbi:MAG: ATP-binding protein, partial [bacterium]|nr:ATP-binding protein [Candidatus Kapabacteria bacterium]
GVIDEVQRAPDLLLAIKSVVDKDNTPGRYLITGSNQPHVGRAVGDSLIGRAAYRTLRPLTLSEMRFEELHAGWSFLISSSTSDALLELERRAARSGPLEWKDIVATGGYPRAVATDPAHRTRMLEDYVTAFVQRDVRAVLGIEDVNRFENFFRLLAARTGQELNANGLGGELGVQAKTIQRWIDALTRSYMIDGVPVYSRNSGQRVIKASKVFFVDAALAIAAARETNASGFHLENLVVSDVGVWRDAAPGRAWYHWRLRSGQEVDLVLEENNALLPVEVKTTPSINWSDARHLRTFIDRHANAQRGVLLSNDPEIRELGPDVIAAPWWAVL